MVSELNVGRALAKVLVKRVRRILTELENLLARLSSAEDEDLDPVLRSRLEEGAEVAREVLENALRESEDDES